MGRVISSLASQLLFRKVDPIHICQKPNPISNSWAYKLITGLFPSLKDSNDSLPKPFADFPELISNFQSHGLDLKDLVVLSGAHSIGLAKCVTFRPRIYIDTNIDKSFATYMQQWCPVSGGDNNTEPLDATPAELDRVYYKALLENKGLLRSDQELFKNNGCDSDKLVWFS